MNITKVAIIGSVILVILFVFLVYLGVIPGLKIGADNAPVELEVWGVFDDSDAITPLIQAFQSKYPNVTIIYRKKTIQNYEDELIRSFAAGKGPDIFMIHNSWVPKFRDLLTPVTADILPINEFRSRFVDVVQKDFIYKENIYGIPLYVDTLALYYNVDLFNSAGIIEPPKTWEEFDEYSKKLTKRSDTGEILVSGAAIGSGKNVLYSADILSLMMMQRGGRLSGVNGEIIFDSEPAGKIALDFYTQFSKPEDDSYSWPQSNVNDSQSMFALGRSAMMFGYSWTRQNILQKSPRLRFKVVNMPQVKNSILKKNYANYWGYGVYVNSPYRSMAWRFLKFLSEPQNAILYLSTMNYPASQKPILATQQSDEKLGIFANQALTADSWFQLDSAIIKEAMVNMIDQRVLSEQSADVSLRKAASEINSKILSR